MDIFDSTIIMVVASYNGKKFFRCSYLIRQFYEDEELQLNQPENIQFDKLFREIKTDKPIIKLYELVWDEDNVIMGEKVSGEKFEDLDMFKDNDAKEEMEERERTLE